MLFRSSGKGVRTGVINTGRNPWTATTAAVNREICGWVDLLYSLSVLSMYFLLAPDHDDYGWWVFCPDLNVGPSPAHRGQALDAHGPDTAGS